MLNKLLNYLALAGAYFRLNLKAQFEYRFAFISQAVAMFVNDCIWLVYFILFFDKFPVLNGWHAADVATLWAVTAAGFGIAHAFFGNALWLPGIIVRGELDTWLLYPRALLPHLVLGRISPSAFGDAIFGYIVYIAIVHPDLPHFLLFTLMTFTIALLFVGFSVATGSLGFYLGNAESLAEHWRGSLIAFSTYPMGMFKGNVRLLLYTVVPAGFVSGFPIDALQKMSLLHAAYSLGGALLAVALAVVVFYHGLSRYESGNMVAMRG
ncbi:MAG TPA: ABC-2 family transporter protein [Candidatus Obscuribacterales bacterium]